VSGRETSSPFPQRIIPKHGWQQNRRVRLVDFQQVPTVLVLLENPKVDSGSIKAGISLPGRDFWLIEPTHMADPRSSRHLGARDYKMPEMHVGIVRNCHEHEVFTIVRAGGLRFEPQRPVDRVFPFPS